MGIARRLATGLSALPGTAVGLLLTLACNGNVYESLADKDSEAAKAEAVRVKLDNRDYPGAQAVIDGMDAEDRDTEEVAILQAATRLGLINLSVWDVIEELVLQMDGSAAGGDALFQRVIDELLGADQAARDVKFAVMRATIAELGVRDNPSTRITNTNCFIGIMLLGATLLDTTAAIADIKAGFDDLGSAQGGADSCEAAEVLGTAADRLGPLTQNLSVSDEVISACPFLASSEQGSIASELVGQMTAFANRADRGCDDAPPQVEQAPTCVQDALGLPGQATAADGALAACEITLNCLSGRCM